MLSESSQSWIVKREPSFEFDGMTQRFGLEAGEMEKVPLGAAAEANRGRRARADRKAMVDMVSM
jgi:hypothetical protein